MHSTFCSLQIYLILDFLRYMVYKDGHNKKYPVTCILPGVGGQCSTLLYPVSLLFGCWDSGRLTRDNVTYCTCGLPCVLVLGLVLQCGISRWIFPQLYIFSAYSDIGDISLWCNATTTSLFVSHFVPQTFCRIFANLEFTSGALHHKSPQILPHICNLYNMQCSKSFIFACGIFSLNQIQQIF